MNGRIVRPDGIGARLPLPRIGTIRTGMKNNRSLPVSVDYFIPKGKYEGLVNKAYGEKPNTIQIIFPSDDPELVCIERYEYRDDEGRLYAKGDGENFDVWDGKVYQKLSITDYPKLMESVQKKNPNRKSKQGSGWDIVLTLNFLIPLVKGVAGYWTYTTKGEASTIPQIRNLFDEVLNKNGFVSGVVFDLSVQFATSNKPNVQSRYPVVSLIPNESDENIEKLKGSELLGLK